MSKQIFGYTPRQPAGDEYVKFCAVMGDEDGNITITVRNARGGINEIMLPKTAAIELYAAIERHVKACKAMTTTTNQPDQRSLLAEVLSLVEGCHDCFRLSDNEDLQRRVKEYMEQPMREYGEDATQEEEIRRMGQRYCWAHITKTRLPPLP